MGKATEPHVGTRTTGKPVRGDRGVCPTRCIYTRAASTPVPHHGVQRSPLPSLFGGGGGHLGKFGERQKSELSTFLFLFFFLRNFFSPTADDFTILGGGGGGWRFWLLLPLHSKCRTKPYIPEEARASEFPKDEVAWRLLPSQLQLPLPQSPALSQAREAPPGWEETPSTFFPSLSYCRN